MIDGDDGPKLEIATSESLQMPLSWSPAILDAERIIRAILSFNEEVRHRLGLLMAQGLREYTPYLQSDAGRRVLSNCEGPLPFPIKLDFVTGIH